MRGVKRRALRSALHAEEISCLGVVDSAAPSGRIIAPVRRSFREVTSPMPTLRLASVPFVNAQPLIWGFREGPYREITTVLDVSPARIPDLLGSRQIDLGLVPSIEIQRLPGVEML